MVEKNWHNGWIKKWMVLFVMLIICLLVYGGMQLYNPRLFPVDKVIVRADLTKENELRLKELLQPLFDKSFFFINLHEIRDSLQQLLWVEQVEAQRIWPDQVKINIYVYQPVAYWGGQAFLNIYSEKFARNGHAGEELLLPKFTASEDLSILVLDRYQQMNRILETLGLKVVSIDVNSNESWCIILDNGIKLQLGQEHILTRLQHFVKVYNKVVKSRKILPQEVDLRYGHGMAVKW